MASWKKTLPPILFAIASVASLFAALEERVIDGGPIRYTWLGPAVTFFAIAVAFFVRIRKSGGGVGPPTA